MEDCYEDVKGTWEDRFGAKYGRWRGFVDDAVYAFAEKKRGRKPSARNPLEKRVEQLEKENARLRGKLKKAETILEVQGKVAGLLGFSLTDGRDS